MANKIRHFERNPGNVAFCYYRYSSEAQRDVSIDQQREAAHAFAKEHGYIIPKDGEFEDRANRKRGRLTISNREKAIQLLDAIQQEALAAGRCLF